ncbi:MAG: hypothetical protein GXP29_05235 [Planctomycetes bacterium]|nr:hypothetical protein [Planctomycetota bacterium]
MIRWAAVILASLSWVFAFHQHVKEVPARQWFLVALAVVCGVVGFRQYVAQMRTSRKLLWTVLPLVVILLLALPAYRLGPLTLLCGVCLVAMSGRSLTLRSAGIATLFVGSVLLLQSATYWATMGWTARNPDVPFVGAILYQLLSWLGADVSYSGGRLGVRMMRSVHEFPLQWEHVAIFPMVQIWLAGLFVAWLSRTRRSFLASVCKLTATMGAYAIVRLFVMIPLFVTWMLSVKHEEDVVHVELFWTPWMTVVSLLPLILVLARFIPWPADAPDWTPNATPDSTALGSRSDRRTALIAGTLACFCAAVAVNFWDPGTKKEGRVLLDEAHSRWERTDNPYTTDWYGHESGYNYYCMAEYLKHYYSLDVNMDGKLTADRLAKYDVLILKTPTDLYSDEELVAIEDFVRRGGGLFALGEHTNVFGSSVALNPVTRRFDIAFRYNSVFDLTRKWEQVHIPGGNKRNLVIPTRLGVHPIMQNVPFYRFAVSCSIATDGWKIRPVIRSTGLWSLPIDYAAGNFYPHVEDLTYARFGAFNQTVCTTAGAGRVVAFGDSTVYSNFLAFYPGKPEMLLGAVEWLNRKNSFGLVNPLMLVACIGFLGVMVWASARTRPDLAFSASVIACGAGAAWLGMWTCAAMSGNSYAAPEPHKPVQTIVFDMDHSVIPAEPISAITRTTSAIKREFEFFKKPKDKSLEPKKPVEWPSSYELPLFGFTKRYQDSYEIFYQWVLRLGYYTTVTFDLDQALEREDPIVLIRPQVAFGGETMGRIRAFLNRGGSILVLDSPTNKNSVSEQVLSEFGLILGNTPVHGGILVAKDKVRVCGGSGMLAISGGTPLLSTPTGEVVASVVAVGKGQIVACGLADRFTDARMGGSSRGTPTPEIRAVYELEFALMRGLVEKNYDVQMQKLSDTFKPTTTVSASR